MVKIVSACLLGIKCKYNGKSNFNEKVFDLYKKDILIPVCPEVFAGLGVPREEIYLTTDGFDVIIGKGKILTKSGKDVTEKVLKAVKFIANLCKKLGVKEAILKQKSPSCGCGKTYINGELKEGYGVLAAMLIQKGVKVVTEENL